ncbi:NAD(P)-binding protein [Nostoc piscinale]|uniref:NAD(P)-binding protein n=1 Tax=Nostoc piscinale TaxID=224012 RepID=UPI000A41CC60|nr:NAD(P)-binding protein [Nostoc piscinale]
MNIKQSNSKHIYILGAGPAGLASAYTLTKQDESVVVVDKDSQVGGLSKSIVYQGFILDYGAHYLCTSPQPVLELFNEILGSNKVNINTLIRVYWRKKILKLPSENS